MLHPAQGSGEQVGVRQIVEQHGGAIIVRSQEGRGQVCRAPSASPRCDGFNELR
jgi:hypothetical protein